MAENTGSGDFSIRLDGLITCWMKITVQFLCWMKVPEEWRLTVHSALLFSGWCSCTTVLVIRALFWNKEVYFCSVHHWLSSLRSSLTQLLEMQWSLRKLKHRIRILFGVSWFFTCVFQNPSFFFLHAAFATLFTMKHHQGGGPRLSSQSFPVISGQRVADKDRNKH